MGYFLTTEPENAVPPKSLATPKTHVPGSRVKDLGQRYYLPETGRWASRDPICEKAFRHFFLIQLELEEARRLFAHALEPEYLFVLNGPLFRVDSFGAWWTWPEFKEWFWTTFDGICPPIGVADGAAKCLSEIDWAKIEKLMIEMRKAKDPEEQERLEREITRLKSELEDKTRNCAKKNCPCPTKTP